MNFYDAIVLGTGGVGSAATFHLAQRGLRVLGLDRFPPGHDRGSSHGHTRIIRMAYFEHSDYVPLLRRSYQLWADLERRREKQLYFPSGLIEVGPPDGIVIPGVLRAAAEHGLVIDRVDEQTARTHFPGFHIPAGYEAVFEGAAGYLLVEECVRAHLSESLQIGAELRTEEEVVSWNASDSEVEIRTRKETYRAARLVITGGAWSARLLADLNVRLQPRRKHLHWYRTHGDVYRADRRAPCFFYEIPEGYFYGFPQLDDRGIKVAEHSGGIDIEDPLTDDRAVDPNDRARVETFLGSHMPGVLREPADHAVCYYTMSADEHFIVDQHPRHTNVCFATGLSGHGFKFTSVLGEILADLAVNGRTDQPIAFLSVNRPGLLSAAE